MPDTCVVPSARAPAGPPAGPPEVEVLPLADVDVEVVRISGSRTLWGGFQKTWDLCLIDAGAARWRYREETMRSEAGDLRWKEPGEVFRTVGVDAPTSLRIVQISDARLQQLLEGVAPASRHFHRRQASLDDRQRRRVLAGIDGLVAATTTLERGDFLVGLVEAALLPNLEARPMTRAGGARRAMLRVREHIAAYVGDDLRLADLAALVDMHEVALVRAFRAAFGLPPHAYQIELRVDEARRALLAGDRAVDVAVRLGFVDQSHLIRHFKRIVGVTPGRYAQASRATAIAHAS